MTDTLQKLLFIRSIYSRKTAASIAFDYTLLLVAVVLVSGVLFGNDNVAVFAAASIAGGVAVLLLIVRSSVKAYIAIHRVRDVRHVLAQNGVLPTHVSGSSIYDELPQVNRTKGVASGNDWNIFEIEVDIVRNTKYGDYLGKQIYYTVYEARLRRQLPNLLFDSRHAKGSQFKYRYLGSQRLSLEGNFDDSFTVYAPDHYKIDTLSFITPEVMLAFKEARAYDIEILNDRLFLYGPLMLNQADVDMMRTHGEALVAALNDNIDTYADSYLTGVNRRTHTTKFARQLLESPLKPILGASAALILLGGLAYMAIRKHDSDFLTNEFTFFVVIFLVSYVARAIKILYNNRRMRGVFEHERKMEAYAKTRRLFYRR